MRRNTLTTAVEYFRDERSVEAEIAMVIIHAHISIIFSLFLNRWNGARRENGYIKSLKIGPALLFT